MFKKNYNVPIDTLTKLDKNTPLNIVLSGGGYKCIAHIAFLKKIQQLGFTINSISASSGGALIAALYASGKNFDEIKDLLENTPIFQLSFFSLTKAGIFDTYNFKKILEQNIHSQFSDLKLPIYVVAVNMEKGKAKYFSKGELIKPVLASCAIPALFCPVKIKNTLYSDGGILDNYPIKPFLKSKLPIVGSYVNEPPKCGKRDLNSTLKVLKQATLLMGQSVDHYKFNHTDVTVKFPLSKFNGTDVKEVKTIYKTATDYLKDLK